MKRLWILGFLAVVLMAVPVAPVTAEENVARDALTLSVATTGTATALNDAASIKREGVIRHIVLTMPDCDYTTATVTLVEGTTVIYTHDSGILDNATTTVDVTRYVSNKEKIYARVTWPEVETAPRTITAIVYTSQ